jgi:hypothetical protein
VEHGEGRIDQRRGVEPMTPVICALSSPGWMCICCGERAWRSVRIGCEDLANNILLTVCRKCAEKVIRVLEIA